MVTIGILIGTLILYLPTPHGAYVAADSRHDGGDPAQADQAQKVFLCGPHAVCAISGAMRLNVAVDTPGGTQEGTLDLSQLLASVSTELGDGSSEEIARRLAYRMQAGIEPFWRRHLEDQRVAQPMSLRLGAQALATVLLARREANGRNYLAQIQLQFSEERHPEGGWVHRLRSPYIHVADGARPLAQGKTLCMRINPEEKPAAKTREQTLESIRALFSRAQEIPSCASVIGGLVDVAVIEANEANAARWLTRKSETTSKPAPAPLDR